MKLRWIVISGSLFRYFGYFGEASADARHPASGGQGAHSPYADMRLACLFALVVRIDFSPRGQGCWSVMWRKLLWPKKLRWAEKTTLDRYLWIVISLDRYLGG